MLSSFFEVYEFIFTPTQKGVPFFSLHRGESSGPKGSHGLSGVTQLEVYIL